MIHSTSDSLPVWLSVPAILNLFYISILQRHSWLRVPRHPKHHSMRGWKGMTTPCLPSCGWELDFWQGKPRAEEWGEILSLGGWRRSGHSYVENLGWESGGNLILLKIRVGVQWNSLNLVGAGQWAYQNHKFYTTLASSHRIYKKEGS